MSRIFLGAFGDPGHAFPMIALGRELARRGHDVTMQTWAKWGEHVEAGVGTLGVSPLAFTREERLTQLRQLAELAA